MKLTRYRQFINEHLTVDPQVTVVVGRNDTGKTGLLDHFFHQCVYENVIAGGDRPQVPGYAMSLAAFSMVWDILPEDYDQISFPENFGPRGHHVLELSFQDLNAPGKYWIYRLDGRECEAYEGTTPEGMPIRKEGFRLRHILPTPHYVSVGGSLLQQFEMRPYDLPVGPAVLERQQLSFEHRRLTAEAIFLRIAGIRAQTRSLMGLEKPWQAHLGSPSALSPAEINARLQTLSERLTSKLRDWWSDPPGLSFKARLAEGPAGSYAAMWTVQDTAGLTYHGTGLLWFITFLVEWLFVEDYPGPLLLLFDEPATPLHPSAQRVAARLLASISPRHQVIYSTHSPFMIDWNFPQRIRLFTRDHESKRTQIENKPYHPREGIQHIWDPLRESIGVTLGDVGILGQANVLVEGVSDQVLLANASDAFASRGKPHFDLATTSILPFGDASALGHLIAVARSRAVRVVVLTDADEQGAKARRLCEREAVVCISVGDFAERADGDRSVEDVLGTAVYVAAVNDLYRRFHWFAPIDDGRVQEELAGRSLGRYFQALFEERFQHRFDKIAVAISIAQMLAKLPDDVLLRFQSLIERINSHF